MATLFKATPKVDQLRAKLGHPIVDADAHQIEMVPLFLDFLREVGGAKMAQRWRDYVALTRRVFRMTPEERSQARPGIPVWLQAETGLIAGAYAPGINAFNALMAKWREKGDLEGLKLS
jgi:hypothetical protein